MCTDTIPIEDQTVGKKKTTPIRLSEEAIRVARIASGYTGESVAEYASRIVIERGNDDIERLHAQRQPKGKGGPK